MAVVVDLFAYDEPLHLLGVVAELQLIEMAEDEKVSLLREWCESVGRRYDEWMGLAVLGPPIGTFGPGELEV